MATMSLSFASLGNAPISPLILSFALKIEGNLQKYINIESEHYIGVIITLFIFFKSILGHKYNDDFRQRMQTRQSRRNFMGYVDQRLTSCAGAGLANKCSPFQALHIPVNQIDRKTC